VDDWQRHPSELVQRMLDHLDALMRAGAAAIEN